MDGQWTNQVQAWSYTQSLHYTFPAVSAIMQISLTSRVDREEWTTPVANAIAAWTSMTTTDGGTQELGTDGITSTFVANHLQEAQGFLIAENCYSEAIVNAFIWPSVF